MNERPKTLREARPNAIHDARMAARPARPIVSWTITMGLGGLLLGYVGATDSYELPLLVRLSLWLGLCAVGGVIAVTIERAAVGSGLQSRSFLFWWILLTAGLAVAMIPVIFLVNSSGSYSQFANLPLFALNSFAISAALVAFRLLIGTLPVSKVPDEKAADDQSDQAWSAEQAPERPLLLGRLTAGLQSARLLALKSEGHYLKVFTDQGSELILMRLKDALAETGPVEGMQVHRSWWLARREGIERRNRDGRIELKLDEDNWVPVSRTHRSAWLKEDW